MVHLRSPSMTAKSRLLSGSAGGLVHPRCYCYQPRLRRQRRSPPCHRAQHEPGCTRPRCLIAAWGWTMPPQSPPPPAAALLPPMLMLRHLHASRTAWHTVTLAPTAPIPMHQRLPIPPRRSAAHGSGRAWHRAWNLSQGPRGLRTPPLPHIVGQVHSWTANFVRLEPRCSTRSGPCSLRCIPCPHCPSMSPNPLSHRLRRVPECGSPCVPPPPWTRPKPPATRPPPTCE
mmetsp:Transcript_20257/g.50630  ORF Transcript_20257/g.50630 Transcript_20257/m.50630 type:complete len:229 (-) Transcript_20257:4554-5240(-)